MLDFLDNSAVIDDKAATVISRFVVRPAMLTILIHLSEVSTWCWYTLQFYVLMKFVVCGFSFTKIDDQHCVGHTTFVGDYMQIRSMVYSVCVCIVLLQIRIYVQCNTSIQGSNMNRSKIHLFC
jgi:hypothetical protein